jgi:hypothetical protein
MNETIRISRDFAYYLKREHLYSNYRVYLKKDKESYDEYRFWCNVLSNFYAFLVNKYKCENDIILN